ncbi:cytochrome C oxidase subunit IV family protein [Nocardia sp. CA-151230]|uniref:cytochrome C oxidase subunit IV family protein n=1 Tax=Nocardia sp. CA-151230 TaxID=3239982 RepID=UPI003D8B837A
MREPTERNPRIFDRLTIVWSMLVLATVVTTWILSKDHLSRGVAVLMIFAIAAWKVRYVLLDFMELRDAPRPARIIAEGWSLTTPLMIMILYWRH